ncbi:MAG: ABC transporter permease [Candidatus Caenarcaniphilales bacterium]|nr:ABC transporter permease [Candidatus Caenarcaniphilales bacterium]
MSDLQFRIRLPNYLVIAWREFKTIVFTKWYLASIVLVPLVVFCTIVGAFFIQFANVSAQKPKPLIIADRSGKLGDYLASKGQIYTLVNMQLYSDTSPKGSSQRFLKWQPLQNLPPLKDLENQIEAEKYAGLLEVPADFFEKSEVRYITRNTLTGSLPFGMQEYLENYRLEQEIALNGLTSEQVESLRSNVKVNSISVILRQGTKKAAPDNAVRILAAVCIYGILSIAIAIHGSKLTMSILEEKSSKIVEILLSCVKPLDLMWGKIIGGATAAILQMSIWGFLLFLIFVYSGAQVFEGVAHGVVASGQTYAGGVSALTSKTQLVKNTIQSNATPEDILKPKIKLDWKLLMLFFVFAITGFVLYATVFAAVGAVASSVTEAQHLETPLVFLMMFPTYLFLPMMENPNGPVIVLSSFFPYFSPFVMYSRICVDQVPWEEILLSILLIVLAIVLNIYIVSALYRAGILLYGKKLTMQEVFMLIKKSLPKNHN